MNKFVTNASWAGHLGRPDAIDDVADQFERRTSQPVVWPASPRSASARSSPLPRAAAEEAAARWPRSARGWRSLGGLHPRPERLAPN